jgi:hypothetical protein
MNGSKADGSEEAGKGEQREYPKKPLFPKVMHTP